MRHFVRALCAPLLVLSCAARAQMVLPEVNVRAPAPIVTVTPGAADDGVLAVDVDTFGTVTAVPKEEIQRNGGGTLGDLLNGKAGIASSGFAPGASSRPIIRGLDANRVRIQENGVGANGASDLGEDHFTPVDPLSAERVEVIRGPATLRYGATAIGGVVEATNNRIPTFIPLRGFSAEMRGAGTSADNGLNGAVLLDAGAGNFAVHADAFGRTAQDYRVPRYPYLTPPDPAVAPRATQPGAFNGRQRNSSLNNQGGALGGSYLFDGGFVGLALIRNEALYKIPGIAGENANTRIDAGDTKLLAKGEWRAPNAAIDALRFWAGATDYQHRELGLADPLNLASDGVRQIFTNREQEGRFEAQFAPFDLGLARLTTTAGVAGGHQELTAPSPGGLGLWDPNSNRRVAGYLFNEFRFTPETRAQIAGRIEHVDLAGTARAFDAGGVIATMPVSPAFTPKSASAGILQDLPLGLTGSLTAQYVERAPKPAELFSGGPHDATTTFDKGNPNLRTEAARSFEAGLRRAGAPFRFELAAYDTHFNGFIFRRLTGNQCDDAGVCGAAPAELKEAVYSQANAHFRGIEWQSQYDVMPLAGGTFGVENQFDMVRATFADGSNVPRIPPMRLGGGVFWRDAGWLARVNLLHAFPQRNIALAGETPTGSYNDLRAEVSYRWKPESAGDGFSEVRVGIVGTNLLNDDIRNHVSYSKDEVLMPGASVRIFANVRY